MTAMHLFFFFIFLAGKKDAFSRVNMEELAGLEKLASTSSVFFHEQQRDACEDNHETSLGPNTVKVHIFSHLPNGPAAQGLQIRKQIRK